MTTKFAHQPDQALVLLVQEQENEHPGQRPEGDDGQDMLTKESIPNRIRIPKGFPTRRNQ